MVQSKNLFTEIYYVCITNIEIVQNSKSKPKNLSFLCTFKAECIVITCTPHCKTVHICNICLYSPQQQYVEPKCAQFHDFPQLTFICMFLECMIIFVWMFVLMMQKIKIDWKKLKESHTTVQMKGRWESNMNVRFPEMKLFFPKQNYNVLSPSSYTCISVKDLYISRIGLPMLLQENMWTDPGNR